MLTATEIAAWLGVHPSRVRQVIARNGIEAAGRRGRAALYDASEVLRHAGEPRWVGATA